MLFINLFLQEKGTFSEKFHQKRGLFPILGYGVSSNKSSSVIWAMM